MGVHVPPVVVIVYWYVVGTVIPKLPEIVPEISINVPPSATTVLLNEITPSSPNASLNDVLTLKSKLFEVRVNWPAGPSFTAVIPKAAWLILYTKTWTTSSKVSTTPAPPAAVAVSLIVTV